MHVVSAKISATFDQQDCTLDRDTLIVISYRDKRGTRYSIICALCTNTQDSNPVSVDEVRVAYLRNENSCRRRTSGRCVFDSSLYRPYYIVGCTRQSRTLCAVLTGNTKFVVVVDDDFDSASHEVRLIFWGGVSSLCGCVECTEEQHGKQYNDGDVSICG